MNYLKLTIIIALFIIETQQINNTLIDLKQFKSFNLSSQLDNLSTGSVVVQIYSNQLNDENKYFSLDNTMLVLLNQISRSDLCSNIKYCETNKNENLCILNLNFISYYNNKRQSNTKQKHVNKIKSTKLYLLISDFTDSTTTNLTFESSTYEFNVSTSTNQEEALLQIGNVKAIFKNDTDLNDIIKYYLEFKDENRIDYNNLFQIDISNGNITMNRQYTNSNKSFEFYVNAIGQCGIGQKPIRSKTLVKINLNEKNRIDFRVKNLIETKYLSQNIECIRLNDKELMNDSHLALAQITVNAGLHIEVSDLENDLKLFGLKPNNTQYNQLNKDDFSIQRLVDNIFVVYLGTKNFEQIFLNDIYKLQLQVNETILDIYICIDTLESSSSSILTDSFSLVQFSQNIYQLNPPVHIKSDQFQRVHDSSSVILEAYQLSSSSSNIQFYLDDNLSSNMFNLTLKRLDSSKTQLIYNKNSFSQDSVIEKLQYELIAIGFDSTTSENNSISQVKRVVYNDLTRQALNNKKFLRFTAKIYINTVSEININDSTVIYNNSVYHIYVKSDKAIKNSIIGYLPNIYDLKTKYSLSFNTKQIEYLYYRLAPVEANNFSIDCVKLNKFDGVISISQDDCFQLIADKSLKFKVYLSSLIDQNINDEIVEIQIHGIRSENKNENLTNLVYSNNYNNVSIQPAIINVFSLSYLINVNNNYQHESVMKTSNFFKLVDLISYFKPNLTESQYDYKTTFEFIQLDKNLNDLFIFDTKKNAIYLNVTKSINDKFIQFKCYHLDVLAKNYIYLNSIKRKLISFDSFKLNLCFFNNETISYRDYVANNFSSAYLIVPFQNENSMTDGFQEYLIRNYNESTNLVLSVLIIVISGITLVGLILIGAYLKRNKKQDCEENSPAQRNYYSTSIDTASTGSTNLSPTTLLKIRNDLSYNGGDVIFQGKDGQLFKLKKSNSNSNSSSNDLYAYGAATTASSNIKHITSSPTIPEFYTNSYGQQDKESSEDQGVYCLATGTSFSMSSNISSVTNSQFVDTDFSHDDSSNASLTTNNIPVSPINSTRFSLFDMTPMRSNRNQLEVGCTFLNELNANTQISQDMKVWIMQNYYQNCAKLSNYQENKQVLKSHECII